MKGIYLRIINHRGKLEKMRIGEFRINESSDVALSTGLPIGRWLPITSEPEHEGTKFTFLKCPHCGHFDFNEDGERLNDYVCDGCNSTISATERKDND